MAWTTACAVPTVNVGNRRHQDEQPKQHTQELSGTHRDAQLLPLNEVKVETTAATRMDPGCCRLYGSCRDLPRVLSEFQYSWIDVKPPSIKQVSGSDFAAASKSDHG